MDLGKICKWIQNLEVKITSCKSDPTYMTCQDLSCNRTKPSSRPYSNFCHSRPKFTRKLARCFGCLIRIWNRSGRFCGWTTRPSLLRSHSHGSLCSSRITCMRLCMCLRSWSRSWSMTIKCYSMIQKNVNWEKCGYRGLLGSVDFRRSLNLRLMLRRSQRRQLQSMLVDARFMPSRRTTWTSC